MSLKGDLKEISIKSIFQMIFIEEKNGSISVVSEDHSAMIFFKGGKIHFGKLDDRTDINRLKLTILNNGYLTEKEWLEIVKDEKNRMDVIWPLLSGRLDKSILSYLFQRQIEYTLFVMLQWKEGEYEYYPGVTPPVSENLLYPYEGKHMLIEGFRAIDEWSELTLRLPPLEASLVCSKNFRKLLTNSNNFSKEAYYIISIIKKEMQFKNLLNSSRISYCETGKTVEQLLCLGILKFSIKPVSTSDKSDEELKNSTFWIYVTGAITIFLFFIFYPFSEPDYYVKQIIEETYDLFNPKSEMELHEKKRFESKQQSASVAAKNIVIKEEEKKIENEVSLTWDGIEKLIYIPNLMDAPYKIYEEKKDNFMFENRLGLSSTILKSEPIQNSQIELKRDDVIPAREINKEIESTVDKNEILDELIRKADMGEIEAQLELGIIYDTGRGGVKEDDAKAVKWYKKAADEGSIADAQFALGVMYNNGEGVEQNYVKAIEWYTKAAAQGYGEAEYNLGIMYYKGEGVDKNKKIAADWFYKSGLSFLSTGNKDALSMAIEALKTIDLNHPALVKLSETQKKIN